MKRFMLTLAFCLAVLAGPLQAQEMPTLSNLEISVWPEFDRPEVLVIQRGLLEQDTPLPVPMEISIPVRVGQPTAVAYVSEDGQRLNQQHTTRVEGDWLVVSFELATLGFQLEYYDQLPTDGSGQREFTYSYRADYPIAALDVEFQVPPTSEDYVLDPPAGSEVIQSDGLEYHLSDRGTVAQGEEQSWTFRYGKDNEDLTVSGFVQPGTQEPVVPSADPATDNPTVWIFLVAFVALIAVGATAFWLGQRTQPDESAPPASRRRKRRGSGRGGESQLQRVPLSGGQEGLFCHECGTELRLDSDYCHRCGTEVRRG